MGRALMEQMSALALLQSVPVTAVAGGRTASPCGDASSEWTAEGALLAFDEVYAANVAFVWRIVRMFGVPDAGLEDAVQDVFVVVYRRLPEWEGRSAVTTWLFAIARRVASSHRRRAAGVVRIEERERVQAVDPAIAATDPFAAAARTEALGVVLAILETMDEDKRIAFALVELEGLTVPEVAALLDLNLNTAYSRLRLARAAFETAVRARGPR